MMNTADNPPTSINGVFNTCDGRSSRGDAALTGNMALTIDQHAK